MLRLHLIITLLFFVGLNAQHTQYFIDAQLEESATYITVSQTVVWHNPLDEKVNILYLSDWSNSFKDTETPLAQRLVEEYDRSFYLAPKTKRGYTDIEKITANDVVLVWLRDRKTEDQITLYLPYYLLPGKAITLHFNYRVKIPDDRFTGFGSGDDQGLSLRHWFIAMAPIINKKWIRHSNLNLDDNSHLPSDFEIQFTYPKQYNLFSNLSYQNSEAKSGVIIQKFEGKRQTKAQFVFSLKKNFKSYQLEDGTHIETDLYSEVVNEATHQERIENIHHFVKKNLPPYPHKKALILKRDYNKNPFYSLNNLPSFLHLFPDHFDFEIQFLKVYLWNYLEEQLQLDKREEHWILGGLQTYLIIKYIEENYGEEKFLGAIAKFPLINRYAFSDLKFNDSFLFLYEWTQSNNLQQADTVSKDLLLKFNEQKASPYHVAVGLRYLENKFDEIQWKKALHHYLDKQGQESFKTTINKYGTQPVNWFFDDYITQRIPFDWQLKKISKTPTKNQILVSEKNGRKAPLQIGWIKSDSLIKTQWISFASKDTLVQWEPMDADYIAINPSLNFPESNKRNNWKALKSPFGIKPLSFRFVKDIEDPKRNQLFFNPITDFNAYDGITLGMRLFNGRLKKQLFNYEFSPQYTFLEKSWVGHLRVGTYFYNDNSLNYLTTFQLSGSSYHYNSSLRYTTFTPHLSFYFRTPNMRSNKAQVLRASWYNVFREKDPNVETTPDYSVLNLRHLISNKGALKYFTSDTSVEFSNPFGKVQWSMDYRKLFPSGRQLSIRFFLGKFLWYNINNTSYFDFNLNRPTDYLFQYNYLGRSDTSGIYSQQLVMAEGGFKSKFENATSNNFMFSTNFNIGLWKWVEAYVDLGITKNRKQDLKGYFDSGLRLNLVPDYLELYLPFASSNGLEINQAQYATKVRFVLTLDPKALTGLYTRKWF
ncbi:MAG: hypothetical protein ACPGVF_06185 [Flavobacteriaceae bacterium]